MEVVQSPVNRSARGRYPGSQRCPSILQRPVEPLTSLSRHAPSQGQDCSGRRSGEEGCKGARGEEGGCTEESRSRTEESGSCTKESRSCTSSTQEGVSQGYSETRLPRHLWAPPHGSADPTSVRKHNHPNGARHPTDEVVGTYPTLAAAKEVVHTRLLKLLQGEWLDDYVEYPEGEGKLSDGWEVYAVGGDGEEMWVFTEVDDGLPREGPGQDEDDHVSVDFPSWDRYSGWGDLDVGGIGYGYDLDQDEEEEDVFGAVTLSNWADAPRAAQKKAAPAPKAAPSAGGHKPFRVIRKSDTDSTDARPRARPPQQRQGARGHSGRHVRDVCRGAGGGAHVDLGPVGRACRREGEGHHLWRVRDVR